MTQAYGLGRSVEFYPDGVDEEAVRANAYREAAQEFMEFFGRSMSWVVNAHGNRIAAFESMLFAMGYGPLLQVKSEVELANRHGVKKQAICNLVKTFQENVRIPPMPGQRREEAISKFREARIAQLKRGFPTILK